MHSKYDKIISFIRSVYGTDKFIPLHEPRFSGNEKKYVTDAIDSTFVSSVGEYVNRFEKIISDISGARHAIAIVNGTCALHMALRIAGVQTGDEVITQPLTFVATANAIAYCGGQPVFLDVDLDTLGLSPDSLESFFSQNVELRSNGFSYNRSTNNRVSACVPMHTFGHPCSIERIVRICSSYNIAVIEDAAESLGSTYNDRQTGTFGRAGIYSFNGNKTVTCGGGGAIITNDPAFAQRAKHITTTAKIPHPYEYVHDEIGYNYRMPNLNAALACAQLEQLAPFLANKHRLAQRYAEFFDSIDIQFIKEPMNARSNYWLNAIILRDIEDRNSFLEITNKAGVMTRPIWCLLNKLPMFERCTTDNLKNAHWLEERVVNIPSSVTP
ncbi:MAG: LegC family aminotransferase [Desulfomonilia bacterium]